MYNIFIYIICSNHLICLNICYTASSCVRYHTPTAPVQVEQVTGHGWHGTCCCATVPCLLDLHKGADMISMDGFDCGGHPGHFLGLTSSAVGLAWSNVILCVCHFSTLYVSHFSHFYHFLSFYVVPSCPFTFDFREIFSLFNHLPIIDRIRRKLLAVTVWPVKAAGLPQLTSDCPACLT